MKLQHFMAASLNTMSEKICQQPEIFDTLTTSLTHTNRCHTVTNLAVSYSMATVPKTEYVSDSFFRPHIFRMIKKIQLINDKGVD